MFLSLTNFRCFSNSGTVFIAPLTVLVGENSSGKTSFLAALRVVLSGFQVNSGNPFNSDPYFLGSYEQIAHYRGGKAGRAKSFSFEVVVPRRRPPKTSTKLDLEDPNIRHKYTFEKGTTQPVLCEHVMKIGETSVVVNLKSGKPRFSLKSKSVPEFELDISESYSLDVIRQRPSFSSYLLSDAIYTVKEYREYLRNERNNLSEYPSSRLELLDLIQTLFSPELISFQRKIFASAPVRIQPRRLRAV